MSNIERSISVGGRGKNAGYPQTSIRCPEPASKVTRELLNLYRDKFQNESPESADQFLSDVLDFAKKHHAGETGKNDIVRTTVKNAIANIQNEELGYKRNSARRLMHDVLSLSDVL
jgi:hypothetical protein